MSSRVLLFSFALWFMVQPSIVLGALFSVRSTVKLHVVHDCDTSNVGELALESLQRRAAVMGSPAGKIGNDLVGLVMGFDQCTFGDCSGNVPESIYVDYHRGRDSLVLLIQQVSVQSKFNAHDFLREVAKRVDTEGDHVDHLSFSVVTTRRTGRRLLGEKTEVVPLNTVAIARVLPLLTE